MRHRLIAKLSLLMTAALIGTLYACSGHNSATTATDNGSPLSATSPDLSGCKIDSMPFSAVLIDAARTYAFKSDGEDTYYTISLNAEWPRRIGDSSIKALEDTLIGAIIPGSSHRDLKEALTDYMLDTAEVVVSPAETIYPSEIPDTARYTFFNNTRVVRTALSRRYVTYQVMTSNYTGGAHPSTVVTPITFDLANSRPVTPDFIFVPGSQKAILAAITQSLADANNCTPTTLTEKGFFSNTITWPNSMSINADGNIEFLYQQYEIAPYSMGIITVTVDPYQIESQLTPEGRALLAQ